MPRDVAQAKLWVPTLDGEVRGMRVVRYAYEAPITKLPTGDYLCVGKFDLREFRDIAQAEYERAKLENPRNPAFAMRPMFYTGSPYGAEMLVIAEQVRGSLT